MVISCILWGQTHMQPYIHILENIKEVNSNSLSVFYHSCAHKKVWIFNVLNNMEAILDEVKCKQQCLWGKISLYGNYFWKLFLHSCTSGYYYENLLSKTLYCATSKS